MYEPVEKTPEKSNQSLANTVSQGQYSNAPTSRFVDKRPEAIQMRKLRELAKDSPQNAKLRDLHALAAAHSVTQKKSNSQQCFGFVDNRPEAVAQRKQQGMMNNSMQSKHPYQFKVNISNYSAYQQSIIQFFPNDSNRILQFGGKDNDGDKKKGDDYCNNVGKSLAYLEQVLQGFIDANIRGAIDIINSNRSKCSVTTSLVSGPDTNTKEYGDFNKNLREVVAAIGELIQFINKITTNYCI